MRKRFEIFVIFEKSRWRRYNTPTVCTFYRIKKKFAPLMPENLLDYAFSVKWTFNYGSSKIQTRIARTILFLRLRTLVFPMM